MKTETDDGAERRMAFGITPYYMALLEGREHRDAEDALLLPAMPASRALQALAAPILACAACLRGNCPIRKIDEALEGRLLHRYDEIAPDHSASACSAQGSESLRLDVFSGVAGSGPFTADEPRPSVADFTSRPPEPAAQTGDGRYPIREVLLTGADPMTLPDLHLYACMAAAAETGVHHVRIATKEMAFRPQRFDRHLADMLARFHRRFPGVHINLVAHFTHPDEILERDAQGRYVVNEQGHGRWLPAVRRALRVLEGLSFVSLESETPVVARVNDDAAVLRTLQEELRRNGIRPKHIFQCRERDGHNGVAVPVERAWALYNEAQRGLPDTARTRFMMCTEWGELEVVSVIDSPPTCRGAAPPGHVGRLFGNGLVVMKVHRPPASARSQGDLVIARRNPAALWMSDYEDRIIYDGRLTSRYKYPRYARRDCDTDDTVALPRRNGKSCAM